MERKEVVALNIYGEPVFVDPANFITLYGRENDDWVVYVVDLRDSEVSKEDKLPRFYTVAYFDTEEDARLFSYWLFETISEGNPYLDMSELVKRFHSGVKEYMKMQEAMEEAMYEDYERCSKIIERFLKALKRLKVKEIRGRNYFYIHISEKLWLYMDPVDIKFELEELKEYIRDGGVGCDEILVEGYLYATEDVIEDKKSLEKLALLYKGGDILHVFTSEFYLSWKEDGYRVFPIKLLIDMDSDKLSVGEIPLDRKGKVKIETIYFEDYFPYDSDEGEFPYWEGDEET